VPDGRCVIAHLDLDAFYASVELLRRPELKGKPVIVSGSGPRAVVTTCTYEARAFGIGSAMPTSRARRLCPHAVLIPPDFTAYRTASQEVWAIVREHVDRVQQLGLDEGYLDLSDMVAPKAAMRRLVRDLRAQTGLSASVGIGPNTLVAKVASDLEKPAGLVALSREMACRRFAGAPPSVVPGIGPKTAERLGAMGIRTIAELAGMPPEALAARFGERQGPWLASRARFEGSAELTLSSATKSQSSETTFDTDIGDHGEQEQVVRRLAAEVSERVVKRGLRGRTVRIKVRLDDWTTVTRARTLEGLTDEAPVIAEVAVDLLRGYAPPRPVRLLGVGLAGFPEEGAPAPEGAACDSQLRLGV